MELQAPCQMGMSPRAGRHDASAAGISACAEIATASRPVFALDAPDDVFECDADRRTNPSSRHPEAAPMPARLLRSGSPEPSRPGSSLRREARNRVQVHGAPTNEAAAPELSASRDARA